MTKKLIIIGGVLIGTTALVAGITVPTVLVNKGNVNNSQTQILDAQKISDLKDKFEKGLTEANSKITDSTKFVEYYEALKSELNSEKTSTSGVAYVLSELIVANTTNIADNDKITIRYDFKLGEAKDSLSFEFKNPSYLTDAQKISDLKDKFEKGLTEANSKITDSTKFVEYYEALKSELNSEKTSTSGVAYVLSELIVANTTNIADNDKITIRYDFKLGEAKDSLSFEFKNIKKPQPEPEKTDWQKVRIVKEKVLNQIQESSNTQSFENLYNLYLNELNQVKNGEYNTTIKLFEFKAEFPKAEKIVNNSYFSIKYEISYNGYSEVLEFKFENKNPIENIKMVQTLTSNKDGYVVEKGVLVKDFKIKDKYTKLDDLVIPEFIEEHDNETGAIYRAQITAIGNRLYWGREIRTLKLPSSIRYIGESAFSYNELTYLDLSLVNLESIGFSAFRNNKISTVIFPETLSQIKKTAFAINEITKLDLSKTKVTIIEELSFEGNKIKDIKFNLNTTEIRERAFYRNDLTIESLNESNFSETKITRIEWYAFAHQKLDYQWNLQNSQHEVQNPERVLKLPHTVNLIGRRAFEISQKMPYYPTNHRTDMHSQMFVLNGDYLDYPKKIKILNEDGTHSDYSNEYSKDIDYKTYFIGRGYFNSALINGDHYRY